MTLKRTTLNLGLATAAAGGRSNGGVAARLLDVAVDRADDGLARRVDIGDDEQLDGPAAQGHGPCAAVVAEPQRNRGGQPQKRLAGVTVSATSFTMATGTKRSVSVRLNSMPAAKSLFGALEVVGRPVKTSKGINVAYRLIPSLRFNPTSGARKISLSAGAAKVASRAVILPVRNRGNTVDPVSGSVSISGGGSGRSGALRSVRILPGKTVNFDLTARRGLRSRLLHRDGHAQAGRQEHAR